VPRRLPAQPHDALFKWAFTQQEHLAGLLAAVLPQAIKAAASFRTLRVEPGSYVSRALRGRHSDILCSLEVAGQPLFLYTLLEHQRTPPPLMAYRVDLYEARIWERYVDAHPKATQIPPILPIVLYNGDVPWTAPTRFEALVAYDGDVRTALAPHTPHFSFVLVNLGPGQADALMDGALTALGRVVLFCLSVAGDDARLEREIGRLSAALGEVLRAHNGLAALEALLRYLAATHRRMGIDKLKGLLVGSTGKRAKEEMVAVLEELELPIERKARREGKREGKREGELEGSRKGQAKMLLALMQERFKKAVPAELAARVQAASEEELARWSLNVLSATTPEAVVEVAPPATTRRATRA